ncbi:acetylornithine deacetylase [Limimonas halophila]|uniref:Acetylornithine deacetylase n=1 Tax=Limimonas halophila TaxID=1082479 RepID=A0A1G7L6L8_9PROT|nr:acetylornithine deacetylase [Limimonas halophila]SDF45192.1 acetylornithine deacetylase [Limimonas halophila]
MADAPSRATLDMLRRLVAHDTTSRNANLELIAEVEAHLNDLGAHTTRVHDDSGRKANLFATLGPTDRPGIALSGHTDVVPVDGQPWSTDPFALHDDGARVYARGTCDMKGFLACCLARAEALREAARETPVHLVFSYDEEVGCLGARRLLDDMRSWPVRPSAVIVGEPTEMQVVNAHKGKLSVRATAHGLSCHSALAPEGVNAVFACSRLAAHLADLAEHKRANGPFDPSFDIPYSTVHAGVIQGGTALNIVPSECSLDFEIRNIPGEDATDVLAGIKQHVREHIEPAMQAVHPEAGFTYEESAAFPGLDTDPDAAVVRLAKQFAGANASGTVAFGTEAGLFAREGMPAVVCGPGSIAQAHKPDEFVSHDQLARCERFLDRLIEHLRAS